MDEETKDIITIEDPDTEDEVELDDEGLYTEKGLIPPKLRSPGRTGDLRKEKAWANYVKSFRSGVPNIYKSALDAGYSKNSAVNMGSFKWFKDKKDKLLRSSLLDKAERNLSRFIDLNYNKIKINEHGESVEEINVDLLRIVADVSKTIVTTLGKDKGYSTKTEVGGKVENEIKINSISYAEPIEVVADVIEDTNNKILEIATNKE